MTLNRRAFVRVLSSVLLVAADLVSNLSGKGYNITFPGQNDFASASQSCESLQLSAGHFSYHHDWPDNLRYNYKPAVVTYPTTTQQIAEIVKIGAREGFKIAARSGGVRLQTISGSLILIHDCSTVTLRVVLEARTAPLSSTSRTSTR